MSGSRRKKLMREQALKEMASARKRGLKFSVNEKVMEFKEYVPSRSPLQLVRNDQRYPSYSSFTNNSTTTSKAETKHYSGDYVQGLATLHKSNIVPVGKEDNPVDYATMRRN